MKFIFSHLMTVLLLSTTANAGPLLPLSVEELTKAADVVVHGKVLSKKVQKDTSGRIYTTVKIQVHDLWKGQVESEVFEVVHGGGILGNRKVAAPYQVRYDIHEEAVVFCRLNHEGKGVTIGLLQGKFQVQEAGKSKTRYVRNLFHGGPPPEPVGLKPRIRMPHQLPLTIQSLKEQVTGGEK